MNLVQQVERYTKIHIPNYNGLSDVELSPVSVVGYRELCRLKATDRIQRYPHRYQRRLKQIRGQSDLTDERAIQILTEEIATLLGKELELNPEDHGLCMHIHRLAPSTIFVIDTETNRQKYEPNDPHVELSAVHELAHIYFCKLIEFYEKRYPRTKGEFEDSIRELQRLCVEGFAEFITLDILRSHLTNPGTIKELEKRGSKDVEGSICHIYHESIGRLDLKRLLEGLGKFGNYFAGAIGYGFYLAVFEEFGLSGVLAVPSLRPVLGEFLTENHILYLNRLRQHRLELLG